MRIPAGYPFQAFKMDNLDKLDYFVYPNISAMKSPLTIFSAFVMLGMTSCGEYDSSSESVTPTLNTSSLQAPSAFPSTDTLASTPPQAGTATQGMQSAGPNAAATAPGSARLNPAHGQPGHRCDIAVGAPLDSKPATAGPTSSSATPVPATAVATPATTAPVKTGAGLNPAHGQPGHRCDIAVGAPLDSKPISAGVSTTPVGSSPVIGTSPVNNANGQKTVANPIPVSPLLPPSNNQAPGGSTAGLNPAHGQPGHRCDLPVGAPLTGAATTNTPVKQ